MEKNKMNSEKETVKKMAKLCCWYDNGKCTANPGIDDVCDMSCEYGQACEKLASEGYRKIPEGSVVFEQKDLTKLQRVITQSYNSKFDVDLVNYLTNTIQEQEQKLKQARKETAKECADIVYKTLTDKQVWNAKHNWWLQNGECFELKDLLKQILKQQFEVE